MTVELAVTDVRAALARAAGTNAAGAGEASTLLLGRLFHETFADLVSTDPVRSGLRVLAEGGSDAKRLSEQLLDHTWQRVLAPRLHRNAALLQASTSQVLMLWKATQNL